MHLSSHSSEKSSFVLNVEPSKNTCSSCKEGGELNIDFEFAFQPIVDISNKTIFGHEALVRGPNGEGALTVLDQVTNTYQFDQACRVKAVKTASELNLDGFLSINFMPNAVYRPELCIRTTLEAAEKYNFPTKNIIFEFNEQELVADVGHIYNIVTAYKAMGFKTALDDFGAGYAGLNFIANFQPDIIKIDMSLLRDIDQSKPRQAIIKAVTRMSEEMNITVLAEGVETIAERDVLTSYGINLFQGYLFCKPSFKSKGSIADEAWL
jgi:EAL domain-containing protein (putative c-di-GMP-specific phosphodiesterase class I)